MIRRFIAAAVQLNSGPDKDANRQKAEAMVRMAAARGAVLIVLPEIFFWRGPRAEEVNAAEPIPGPTTEYLAALARELRVHLVAGSILELAPGQERVFNTSTVFNQRGELIGRYRKLHLFDVDIPGQVSIRESDTRVRGAETVVVQTEIGVIGLSVCYDLRFPELYRRLVRDGAEIVCLPSAFTFPTGAAHWEVLLRARAIENQVYVVAADQFGRSPGGFNDYGHSLIVDPWGTPVARAPDGENVIVAEIDLDYLHRVRRDLPCLEHAVLLR
jgi:deaminated glutathione amidase